MYELKSNTSYIETLNKLNNSEVQLRREWRVNKNYANVPKKIKMKMHGKTEGDKRDETDKTPIVGKQQIILP